MARFVRKEKREIGLPPDELIFHGRRKMDKTLKRLIVYGPGSAGTGGQLQVGSQMEAGVGVVEEYEIDDISELSKMERKPGTVSWLNIDGVHDEEVLRKIGDIFDLDPIMLSNIMNVNQRASVQEYDDAVYLNLKMVHYQNSDSSADNPSAGSFGSEDRIVSEQLSLVIKDSLFISFQEHKGDVFNPVRERIRRRRRIFYSGADYLAFALIDVVIDTYILILSLLGDKIEKLEDDLTEGTDKFLVEQIYTAKRELNYLRKNTLPTREMVLQLSKIDSDLIHDDLAVFVKEMIDNSSLMVESAESYREILSDQLTMYHTRVSSKLNDIMKILTIFSAIFIPLTFIAGIYGTNFDYIPELSFRYAYFIMLGVMIGVAAGMLLFFRSRKWFR
jgi:magnesium transporter